MSDPLREYFDASEAFFDSLIDARADKLFLEMMRNRVDKTARELFATTDEHVTDILKGQLSICYELADGIVQALKAREGKANPERIGGIPGEP